MQLTSKCLVMTSSLFFIPAWFAFTKGLYIYSGVSVITALASINYWCDDSIYDYRRSIDLIVAKISFAIYFISGCVYLPGTDIFIPAITICSGIILFYTMSNISHQKNKSYWLYYHILFHCCVALEQYMVLLAITLRESA
jgi:hypothetical protein